MKTMRRSPLAYYLKEEELSKPNGVVHLVGHINY